jgi:hypothetical protein
MWVERATGRRGNRLWGASCMLIPIRHPDDPGAVLVGHRARGGTRRLEGVGPPDHEVLLREEHPQQGRIAPVTYSLLGGAVEAAKQEVLE